MSDQLMDTSPGGEGGQYEGNLGYMDPVAKLSGQLGAVSKGTQLADKVHESKSTGPNSQGVTPAEKMRYGQTIQESGGGGGKTTAKGHASSEGRFGGTERSDELEDDAAQQRRVQGYGGDKDMDRNIGG
ncbi:hypothetical protein DPSP01_008819 [Paraphaeosphaeria sporulosa]|uniref:Uncharacterized protein n=1 Tax=Paraphaeosphaeria sporulosa TaxID=1460663 RepID=A0A177CC61_9PLEO|nr:uncharacterized protein CC84DRAFT_809006 [Paraphaeosphaeria sporulosa]OAG04906.1 hypothetical protein CC84DRAFT_809006 [Paraphaeosphaeria sporulosa]